MKKERISQEKLKKNICKIKNVRNKNMKKIIEQLNGIKIRYKEYNKFIIYGAGINGVFAYEYLKKINDTIDILAFIDSDIKKQNDAEYIDKYGIPCLSLNDGKKLYSKGDTLVLNAVRGKTKEVLEKLNKEDMENISAISYIYSLQIDKLENLYGQLCDDVSKKVLRNIILGNMESNNQYYREVQENNQYFAIPSFAYQRVDEVFVDCGAYVGDVLEQYLFQRCGTFKKIFAFEPGNKQRKAMEKRVERLKEEWALENEKIEILPYAIGESEKEYTIQLNPILSSSSLISENKGGCIEIVRSISLDDYFKDKEEKPTFIKVDIEGYELEMLKGARQLIKSYHPMLAISVYHRPEDIWVLYDYISSLTSEYQYELRHHSSWYPETILYCY